MNHRSQAPDRRALVDRLLRHKAIRRAGPPAIPRRAQYSPCELSYAQEQIWLAVQLDPQSPAYLIPSRLRVTGALDLDAIAFALNAIVARHEALRTSFGAADGRPMQVVHPAVHVTVPLVDIQNAADPRRERTAVAVARAEARHAFDLSRPPLVRALVVRCAPADHVLLLTMHHLVADGWSMSVLVREFSALYRERTARVPADLPAAPVQYPDFAVWQRQQTGGDAFARAVAHWKERLADLPPTELPTVRPGPASRSGRGGSEPLPFVPDLARGMEALGRRTGSTGFVTCVAAIAVWLHRYSGQRDLAIGAPVANRLQGELETLIGCFVNPVVLRIRLHPRGSFEDVVRHVREVATDAFAHQDVPFGRIVEEARARRDAAVAPLFRVACVFHNTPPGRLDLAGLQVAPFAAGGVSARFDIELNVWLSPDRVGGSFVYDADLFDRAAAARMAGHLMSLLDDGCRGPHRAISELSMLTEAERGQMVSWNSTRREWAFQSASELVAAQARRTPGAPAVLCARGVWDYRTLAERAGRIAETLRRRGVKRGGRVALCPRRSPETIAALLGILETGAAYVPLDTSAPPARLRAQIADARPDLLLADGDAREIVADGLPVVQIADALGESPTAERRPPSADPRPPSASPRPPTAERRPPSAAPRPPTAAPRPPSADDLAYVIYTSGSTGSPKGVMVTHGGLANYLRWAREAYPVAAGSATLLHTSLAFDLTVTSVLVPLAAGGAVRVVPDDDAVDGFLRAFRESSDLGCVKATPAHLRALLDLVDPSLLAARSERFVVGGEALDAALLDRWFTAAPSTRLVNEYGPTETVVGCCVHELHAGSERVDPVPIGTPIANTRLYVMTGHWQAAPVGVIGELWIGGAGVARGYLGRPGLTAERFVPDPFGATPGGRLYRSGDRVRRRAGGVLEYVGRSDRQLKVRGYRVEPGEVEAVLRRQPGVRDAVAVATRDGRGAGRLAAYVVIEPDGGADLEGLRRALRAQLPEYMVPSAIARVASLPTTPHGKVDRSRLPALEGASGDAAGWLPPRTPVEELLAGIWSDVLAVDRVGAEDNFFELGGHSLLGTQMLARVRRMLGVELPLRALFESPTVAALAERVAAGSPSSGSPEVPPIAPGPRTPVAPLSFMQQGLWFLQQLDLESGFLNVPLVLRLRGPLSVPALRRGVAALFGRHDVLRATIGLERGELVQRVGPSRGAALPVVSLEGLAEPARSAAARALARRELERPFDLDAGPLVRCALLRCGAGDHVLCFTLHHLVTDGWSNALLIRELNLLYEAATAGARAPLAAPALQYADFARWQRHWLSGEVLDRQIDYWRRQLGDLLHAERLFPRETDRARASRRRGADTALGGVGLRQSLDGLGRRCGATLFMTLVAAFEVALHAVTGRTVFAMGTDVANRRDAALEGVVGCFVNQLVLRADLGGDPAFDELLARVRSSTLGAYEHQDVPFDRLMRALQVRPERPLVQASIVLQNTPRAVPELPGLAVERVDAVLRETKVDLMLMLAEGPGGLLARLEYDVDLLDAAAAETLLAAFMAILRHVADAPAARVSALVQRLSDMDRAAYRSQQDAYAAARERSLLRRAVPASRH